MEGLLKLINNSSACRAVVVGGGKSGLSALKFLKKRGCKVFLSENRKKEKFESILTSWLEVNTIHFEDGGHTFNNFKDADLIVVSPGVPLETKALAEARSAGIEIIGELGLAATFIDIPVIAVTGTNGKTTVTKLIAELLEAAGEKVFIGGNIGTPLTEYLLSEEKADLAVVEVSSYQLDTAGPFRPDVAVLLNISPDHLDRYDSYAAYADSKMKIFANQTSDDVAVINFDDKQISTRLTKGALKAKKYFYCQECREKPGARYTEGKIVVTDAKGNEKIYDLPESFMHSPNRENAMAAILASQIMGCDHAAVGKVMQTFKRPPHRLDKVAVINGVSFYDDSKATNIGALQSALDCMQQPVILIAGGRDKGGDYRLLADRVRSKVKKIILIGEAAEKIEHALCSETRVEKTGSLEEAVIIAAGEASAGEAVLLSPACASFDMFSSYEHRGRVFQQSVKNLQGAAVKIEN